MRRAPPALRCLAAAGLLAGAAGARAEGLSLSYEPRYASSHVESTDQLGTTTTQDYQSLAQSLRLGVDRPIGPALGFAAGGQLEETRSWSGRGPGATSAVGDASGAYARLSLGLPALASGLTWDLSRSGSQASQTAVAFASWTPHELPDLSLRLTRSRQYDTARASLDQTILGAILTAHHQAGPVDARYALLWNRPRDAVSGTETSSVTQTALVTWNDRLFAERTTVYASARVSNQQVRTITPGTGTVEQLQHPLAGLSLIEVFPAEPATDTLLPNPALVDGDLAAGASIDVGYGPAQGGDTARRDLGVQLPDLLTPVNAVRVWVDRRLPPAVSAAYAWSAWRSDDNRTWTPVAITGPVTFAPFQNRFELPIAETRARYLKVVTSPLAPGITTEPAWAAVLVTELQVLLVSRAADLPSEQASSSAGLSLAATTRVWEAANLTWDLAGSLERRLTPTGTTWSVHNGLSASQALRRDLLLSERVDRQDGNFGVGRLGQTDWSAGLLWRPVRTLSASLVYTGLYVDATPTLDVATGRYVVGPGNFTNGLGSLVRADLYEGVSAQANASGSMERRPDGTDTWTGSVSGSASLTPNPYATAGVGWQAGRTTIFSPDGAITVSDTARVDASLTLRPTSLLSLSGTVGRILRGPAPTTTGSAQLNYAPLRGELQASFTYARTFDTASSATTEVLGPSLRWNVRPGVLLTGTWSRLASTTLVGRTAARTLGLTLSITL